MSEQYDRLVTGKLVGTELMVAEAVEVAPVSLDGKIVGHVCVWALGLVSFTKVIKDDISSKLAIIQFDQTVTADADLLQIIWAAIYSRAAGSYNGVVQ